MSEILSRVRHIQSTCHRVPKQPDLVEDFQLHLPPVEVTRLEGAIFFGGKSHLCGDFIKVVECSDKDYVGFLAGYL